MDYAIKLLQHGPTNPLNPKPLTLNPKPLTLNPIWRGSGDYLMVYFAEMLIVLTVTFDSGGGRLSFCLTS